MDEFFLRFETDIDQLLSEFDTDGEALYAYYRSFCKTATLEASKSKEFPDAAEGKTIQVETCDEWIDGRKYDGATKETVSGSADESSLGVGSTSDHVPVESSVTQKYDGGTVVTTTESINDSSSGSALASGGASVSSFTSAGLLECGANCCIVVNGTRYVGHLRAGKSYGSKLEMEVGHLRAGRSSVSKLEMEESVVAFPRETKKERNRRLLSEDRKIQSVRVKTRRSKRSDKSVKQEGNGSTSERGGVKADKLVATEDSPMVWVRSKEAESFLRRKFRGSCKIGGIMRRIRKRVGKKKRKRIRWRGWKVVRKNFTRVIKWYSCSAVRYARFKSNRRYKPGN